MIPLLVLVPIVVLLVIVVSLLLRRVPHPSRLGSPCKTRLLNVSEFVVGGNGYISTRVGLDEATLFPCDWCKKREDRR